MFPEIFLTKMTKYCPNLNNFIKYKIQIRCIFSQDGVWPKEANCDIRKETEKYWMLQNNIKNKEKVITKNKEKFYVLSMFPYPSGKLHMGHVRVYAISDAIAWFQRLNGKIVIHPMGWDAFGLPAENAAIERKEKPDIWTRNNIETMKKQLVELGISFDWERELATCDPSYYKWTQYIFLKLYEKGLAYRKEAVVNWDPVDNTVLADEQVDENGYSWRSGAKVEKKKLKQWFIRSTSYSKALYDRLNLPEMKQWRDIVKLQRHWIGDCNGHTLDIELLDGDKKIAHKLPVWTDQLCNLHNAKFVSISTEHYLNSKTFRSSEGNLITLNAVNPLSNEKWPIVVSQEAQPECTDSKLCFETLATEVEDQVCNEKNQKMYDKLRELGVMIYPSSQKLRDWLISRQRYWGTPIPIVHCDTCGVVPVKYSDLPLVLPKLDDLSVTTGISPLAKATEWISVDCPKCGKKSQRETDTMDTFVDSSWYYMRYLDTGNSNEIMSEDKNNLLPVDVYIGGKEHAIMHLYYARFISQFCHSIGILHNPEPFSSLLVQGMVLGQTYKSKSSGKYLKPDEVDAKGKETIEKSTGLPVVIEWEKMSKSKHNGIDPQKIIDEYGVDALRLFILADVAPNSPRKWNSDRFDSLVKFMRKLWLTVSDYRDHKMGKYKPTEIPLEEITKHEEFLFDNRNYYLKGATSQYIFRNQISVAISKIQALSSRLLSVPKILWCGNVEFEKTLSTLIIMLLPIMPHFSAELWEGFKSVAAPSDSYDISKPLTEQNWPEVDLNYHLDLKIKVNDDDKATIKIPRHQFDILTQDEAISLAYSQEVIKKILKTKKIQSIDHQHYRGLEYQLKFSVTKIT